MDYVRQLHDACAEGNVAIVVNLLDGELGVDAADDEDTTGLQVGAGLAQFLFAWTSLGVWEWDIARFHRQWKRECIILPS